MSAEYLVTEAAEYLFTEASAYIVTEAHAVALEQSIYEDVQTGLGAIATSYYEAAPATAAAPFIVWSMVDSVNDGLELGSRSGIARLQIDIYSATQWGCAELRNSVAQWAEAYVKTVNSVRVFPDSVSERSFRKGDDPLYRGVVDFTLAWRE